VVADVVLVASVLMVELVVVVLVWAVGLADEEDWLEGDSVLL
jgi:hypothetical protein